MVLSSGSGGASWTLIALKELRGVNSSYGLPQLPAINPGRSSRSFNNRTMLNKEGTQQATRRKFIIGPPWLPTLNLGDVRRISHLEELLGLSPHSMGYVESIHLMDFRGYQP
jgi:hypothetical protein